MQSLCCKNPEGVSSIFLFPILGPAPEPASSKSCRQEQTCPFFRQVGYCTTDVCEERKRVCVCVREGGGRGAKNNKKGTKAKRCSREAECLYANRTPNRVFFFSHNPISQIAPRTFCNPSSLAQKAHAPNTSKSRQISPFCLCQAQFHARIRADINTTQRRRAFAAS